MSTELPDALAATAEASGRRCARRLLAGMASSGRLAAGGWPGTVSEARASAGSIDGASALAPSQLEALARLVNASARAEWLAHAERELGE